ncbi:MAG: calcium:proton antiporter, partial [Dehalococcoidia bacterium]
MRLLSRIERVTLVIAAVGTVLSAVLKFGHANVVLAFIVSGLVLGVQAALVGQATEQLGSRLGPGATGVLQSALGNLPELFFGIFALRAGLITVVQATIVGSILGNNLLVLGLAFIVGGLRHGTQKFRSEPPKLIATLMLLAVSALVVPTLVQELHTPAARHAEELSVACSLVLLIVFGLSIPLSLSGAPVAVPSPEHDPEEIHHDAWPLWMAATILTVASVGSAFVSSWFVDALGPAIVRLHLSEAFTGLVIVAIVGNAVENVVGIQLAARDKMDYAISVILNSPLQIALGLAPALVLLSFV